MSFFPLLVDCWSNCEGTLVTSVTGSHGTCCLRGGICFLKLQRISVITATGGFEGMVQKRIYLCIIKQCSHHHPHLRVRPCDQSTTIASANCLIHTFPILVLDKWKPQWWKLKIHRFRIKTCEICVTFIFISWAILRFWDKFRGSCGNKRLMSYYNSSHWQKHIAIAKVNTAIVVGPSLWL